jgi:hypothetical protein
MDGGCVCDGLWMCMWWNMDVYVIYRVLCVDIYVISLFVLMESKKPKKIAFSPLCRVSWPWHLAKLGSRDPISQLCRVPKPCHSAKIFFKKEKISLPSARVWHSAKNFQKKICRVLWRWHSAKRSSELTSGFLPSADVTLGKGFTECPICGSTRQSAWI